MKNFVVSLFLVFTSSGAMAVWGGDPISYSEAPYVFGFRGDLYCSSTALNHKVLVTAAHCLESSQSLKSIEITRGENGSESDYTEIRVQRILIHPDYFLGFSSAPHLGDVKNDIALIFLEESLNDYFAHVSFYPELSPENLQPDLVSITFHGLGQYSRKEIFGRRRKLEVNASYLPDLNVYKVKAVKINTGVCRGDSGGGLIKRNTLIAVSSVRSEGIECASLDNSAYMSPVASHYCWIIEEIGKTDSRCEKRTL
ncbi:MAG: trypsin-like serine protease [Proteobacteria bacterium]|jgi:hypothetical protein|nr:trypsin-like serine protease [Pseudomonadota bacterium]